MTVNYGPVNQKLGDIGMVDVRYLKLFNAHYGEESELGALLYDAQKQCFSCEKESTKVKEDFANKLIGDEDDVYSRFVPNITKDDLREATYVLGNLYQRILIWSYTTMRKTLMMKC